MALIIPDTMTLVKQSDQELYKLLQNHLSDKFFVWYEQSIENKLPYSSFIIISANFGLLVITLCNFSCSKISTLDSDYFHIKSNKKTTKIKNDREKSSAQKPGIRTRKRSQNNTNISPETTEKLLSPIKITEKVLNEYIQHLKIYPILNTNFQENTQQELAFPIGFAVIMSNITKEQSQEKHLSQLFNQQTIIYKDELDKWKNLTEEELLSNLKNFFVNVSTTPQLTESQIETIKGIIFPEIIIQHTDLTYQNNNYRVIKTLDYRQERIVKGIGTGHRIVYGVAGSGKTLILLARAKLLANKKPENYRILIICNNRSLVAYLKSFFNNQNTTINYQKKVNIFSFEEWAYSLIKPPRSISGFPVDYYYEEVLPPMLMEKLNKIPKWKKWDAVLVDEAQTFFPSWLKACVKGLKDPENGDLLIVSDGNQSLYKRNNFTWKSLGIKAVGRTVNKKYDLDKNYRNTKEILEAAWSIVNHLSDSSDNELAFQIIKPNTYTRNGISPVLHILSTEEKEMEVAVEIIKKICLSGFDQREIAVIYPEEYARVLDKLRNKLQILGLENYWVSETRRTQKEYSQEVPGIRLISQLNTLGLEFKAVLILWVQAWKFNIPINSEEETLNCRRLYVGMTRAQEILHIFGSGKSTVIDILQSSQKFEVRTNL